MKKHLTAVLAGAAAAALSIALFVYVRDGIERDARLRFERQAADAKHVIESRLRAYAGVTYGLRALVAGSGEAFGRAEFHRYVASLNLRESYPGFEVLNYARHVRAGERQRLEAEIRADRSIDQRGYPRFAIQPPGDREQYHVLVYLEPMEPNRFALGFDIASSGVAARVIAQQRDTGELISSGRLLNVGKERAVGLAMRLAVYRNGMPLDTVEERRAAFIGTVGAGYNVRKLMAGVLDETTMGAMRYRFYEAGALDGPAAMPSLLFDSAQDAPGAPEDDFAVPGAGATFDVVLPMKLARRNWQLHFSSPKSAFISGGNASLPWIVLAGGLLLSMLLFAVLYSFSSSRRRAEALAAGITRDLRESEASLAHAQSLARLGNWTFEADTRAMSWSAETFRILGLDAARAAPCLESFSAWLGERDRDALRGALARAVEDGAPSSLELELRPAGAAPRWVHVLLQPSGRRVRGTIMDVSERKHALDAQRAQASQIRELLRRLVSVQEAERRRFSANLHDLVGQSLSVIGLGLETIRSMLPGAASPGAEAAIRDMRQVVSETVGAVREVMSDLRPPLLDDYGLAAALEWYAQQLGARIGLRVAVEGGKLEPRPKPEVEMALFRIAQEALTNVAKHAGASSARVALSCAAGKLVLVVEDDGRGINSTRAANDPAGPGWGMAVMRERAGAVGGAMRVESPQQGTRIVVELAAE